MTVCAGDLCGRLTEMGKVSSMQGAPSKNSSSLLGSLLYGIGGSPSGWKPAIQSEEFDPGSD